MINLFKKPILLIYFLIFISCSSTKTQTSKNKEIVKSFINARNNFDTKKVNSLIEENYSETFIDGNKEIENKNQLMDRILWGKELDSQIKLLNIMSEGRTIITIEENTNFLDVALKRKSRKFKIVYTFNSNKILSQEIDTLPGFNQISKFNSDRYKEFTNYCEQNHLTYNHHSFNQEFGIHL
jgi:hypothetical protein